MMCFFQKVIWSRNRVEIIFCKQENGLFCSLFFLKGVKISRAAFAFFQEASFRA